MRDIFRFLFVIVGLSFFLFLYIREQNEILVLRRGIPLLEKQIREIEEQNLELEYAIETAKNPKNLMKKVREPEYGHLRFPSQNEVITVTLP